MLQNLLGLRLFEAVGLLEGLFQFACQYADDGRVGKWEPEYLALSLEWSGDAEQLVAAFRNAGWIDGEGSAASLHDWFEHCPRYILQRQERKAKAAGDQRPPTGADGDEETPSAAYQGKGGETENNAGKGKKAIEGSEVDEVFTRLKALKGLQPCRRSKQRAEIVRLAIQEIGLPDILEALARFPLDKAKLWPDGFVPHFDWLFKIDFKTKQPTSTTIDNILDGKYSKKSKKETETERRRAELYAKIHATRSAIQAEQNEQDRLRLQSELTTLTDQYQHA